MQKRVLFLGASYAQIPIIREAKNRGWYIVTCDYLPDNPGHKLANEYYNVSTTDFEGVLNLVKKVKPDFVIAYASDPAAPVAAYVSEKLGLQGNSFESVKILSEKDLFRDLMKKKGFNVPKIVNLYNGDNFSDKLNDFQFPLMIKPTDSSGSKGITKVENFVQVESAFQYALQFSRNKRIIAEEYIDNEIADVHGDGYVLNSELIFCLLGDHIYNKYTNSMNPTGTLWPSVQPVKVIKKIESDVAEIIKESGFKTGPINIEARVNSEGKHFIMEIGPRSGGHFVPQAIYYATGFNMLNAILDQYIGKGPEMQINTVKHTAYYAIHSNKEGILIDLKISDNLTPFIKEFHQFVFPGERVRSFNSANAALGILLLQFNSRAEMEIYFANMTENINLEIT